MSKDAPSGKIPISLVDPERRKTWEGWVIATREAEQWPTWKRFSDPLERDAARRAFHDRWTAFMEGGWEALISAEPAPVEAGLRRAMQLIPAHPETVEVSELVARVVDIEQLAEEEHLFAALLQLERHGQAVFAAGHAYRPPPCVPRRGRCLEDMFLLFGYAPARETGDGS